MEKDIYNLLDNLKNGIREDFNIYVGVEEYKDIVKLGRNRKEKLQLLIMCYVNNPTIEELNNWTLEQFLEYVKETDDEEFFEQDMVEIRKCIDLINEKEIIEESDIIMSDKWKETSSTYKFLKDIIEDISCGEKDIEYDIDKSINKIMGNDYLWSNFYDELYSDLVEKESE